MIINAYYACLPHYILGYKWRGPLLLHLYILISVLFLQDLIPDLYILWTLKISIKNIFFLPFFTYIFLLFTNPWVEGWLSIDHSRGAALLHWKPWPRRRSSTNGLAPSSPRTCPAWWVRGWLRPRSQDKGFSAPDTGPHTQRGAKELWGFFFFFDVDYFFLSPYWICYNIISVLCFLVFLAVRYEGS